MRLKEQRLDGATALRADVRLAASVDALVSCGAAAVGQEHRGGALGAGLRGWVGVGGFGGFSFIYL